MFKSIIPKRYFLLLICTITLLECVGQQMLHKIETTNQFQALAGNPLNTNLGQSESVKIIYDLKTEKMYFINARVYHFHYEFVTTYLYEAIPLEDFNSLNYGIGTNRRYLLGNINLIPKTNEYFIDLSVFDQMPSEWIVRFYREVRDRVFFKDQLRFFLNTERLLSLEAELNQSIAVLTPSEFYKNRSFQKVSEGECIGKLRIEPNLDSLSSATPLHPEDILITKGTPRYFPHVAAILTDEFQTPLSHLSILGKNRGIPIAVDQLLLSDSNFLKLNGKWVRLEISDLGITYKLTQPKYRQVPDKKAIRLKADTNYRELIPVEVFKKAGPHEIGNKAYHFGLLLDLQKLGEFKIPESAYAVPFYFYLKHVNRPEIRALTTKLDSSASFPDDSLKMWLKALRNEIKQAPLDPELVAGIKKVLQASEFQTFRFRSSTNAEDAAGFSGAGLYESKTVDFNDSTKTIERAILNVWASLWSYEAFQERRFFAISDVNLAMGILIHRSFPNEEVNGVIISKNVYRSAYEGITINAQLGDVSVVQPPKGVICDQLVIFYEQEASAFDRTVEYLTNSNLSEGTPVLSPDELKQLELAVETIKEDFWQRGLRNKKYHYRDLGLDIEFKLQGKERELYIKQVRFFND